MKKVLYGILAISALAATSAWAAPVQVGEAAGSAATSVSAGSSSATSVSTVSSAVGVALAATGGGDGSRLCPLII
ncbi:exopolysaccharide production protein YjbE [Shigella dysenteriae]|uniref:exopolysaccharide production protein YjbE n=1 Tax=Shigella TaxID=620 RepID=UPI000CF5DCCD|nr:exopolysaccharide production protein YjbE [Shigella dysenteriae]